MAELTVLTPLRGASGVTSQPLSATNTPMTNTATKAVTPLETEDRNRAGGLPSKSELRNHGVRNQIPITGSLAKGYKKNRFQFVV